MAERRTIDVAKLKADFRRAAEARGIDPIDGATTFQASNVAGDNAKRAHWKRCHDDGYWWAHPQFWLVPRSFDRSAHATWIEQYGEFSYHPPHKSGHLIRNLEDKVLQAIFWQALNLTTQPVEVRRTPIRQMADLFREVLAEMRTGKREDMPLREIHHMQGYELRWIVTNHGNTRLVRAAV